jgi:mannosyltransferase OCH1-like enzyme
MVPSISSNHSIFLYHLLLIFLTVTVTHLAVRAHLSADDEMQRPFFWSSSLWFEVEWMNKLILTFSLQLLRWLPWMALLLTQFAGFRWLLRISSLGESSAMVSHPSPLHMALKQSKYSSSQRRIPLYSLTGKSYICKEGFKAVEDLLMNENLFLRSSVGRNDKREIPKLMHQTSRSRCLTPTFYNITQSWRNVPDSEDWSFLFHDQAAMGRFLGGARNWKKDFGLLDAAKQCLHEATATVTADLWRYLILYEYGGVYADIDSAPSLEFNFSLLSRQQAFFVVDQYDLLSQYFFAFSPKHPLLYYTIHHVLQRVLAQVDTGAIYPGRTTGPHALLAGFTSFLEEVGQTVGIAAQRPIQAGFYTGRDNWTVTVLGTATKQNQFVVQQGLSEQQKVLDYHAMGMDYYLHDLQPSNRSCLNTVLHHFVQ